jgi:hypothetical protein
MQAPAAQHSGSAKLTLARSTLGSSVVCLFLETFAETWPSTSKHPVSGRRESTSRRKITGVVLPGLGNHAQAGRET